jgi:hypothetical protein
MRFISPRYVASEKIGDSPRLFLHPLKGYGKLVPLAFHLGLPLNTSQEVTTRKAEFSITLVEGP